LNLFQIEVNDGNFWGKISSKRGIASSPEKYIRNYCLSFTLDNG